VSSDGTEGDGSHVAISGDGRYVFFSSPDGNLVPDDTNGVQDLFVRDRTAGRTVRVSVPTGDAEADGHSARSIYQGLAVSADGRTVAWMSDATNLVPGDTNGASDIFVRGPCQSTSYLPALLNTW